MTEERFDELLNEMRDDRAPALEAAAARDRVLRQVLHSTSTSIACAELRPEFPAYRAGELSAARRLLIDDHLARCAECRKLFDADHQVDKIVPIARPVQGVKFAAWTRWAAAAVLAVGALYLGRDTIDNALAPSGPRATVASVSGVLQRLQGEGITPGSPLGEREVVRTGAGSRAVLLLADGSRVELNQRTELAIRAAWSGETIQLHHGDVIVQAAKQRRGHLRVVTNDSTASVKGTIFAVSSGTAGSLVSVVEGSVAVTQPGVHTLLTAGKQSATNAALSEVPVRQAVSWSADAEKYFALLTEFAGIEEQLAALPSPSLRTQSALLRVIPAKTAVYFALPNLDGTLRQAMRLIDDRARENKTLGEWWSSAEAEKLRQVLDHIQTVTPLLGDEVVFVLLKNDSAGKHLTPLMLAQVQPGREARLVETMDRISASLGEKVPYKVAQGLLLISENSTDLTALQAQLGTGANSPFAAEIARRYQSGAGWLLGLDALAAFPITHDEEVQKLGAANVRYLFFEQRSMEGRDENQATVAFNGARTGIASWLAAPGASASAEYVSSEAVLAFSAATRDPRQAIEELIGAVTGVNTDFQRFESETGIRFTDIAGALGTDFTFAIERPSLPIPGWLASIEVVNPNVLDESVRRAVDAFNRQLPPDQASRKITLAQEVVNGRTWMSVASTAAPATLHWTYDRGFLIASTDRALAARAISIRATSSSLVRSQKFQERMPSTGAMHHSGFAWLNTSGVIAGLAVLVDSPAVKTLLENRDPLLVVIDGETERIRAASRSRLTSLVLDAMMLHGAVEEPPRPGQPKTVEKKLKSIL